MPLTTLSPAQLFSRLEQYTKKAYEKLGIDFIASRKRWNNYGPYGDGEPSGHVMHYTGSPHSKYRLTAFLRRFRINQWITRGGRKSAGVGIAFAVFDRYDDRLEDVRVEFPDLFGEEGLFHGDVFHWGLDLCFYSSNWANPFTVGTEIRNAGKLRVRNGKPHFGKSEFTGRTVKIRDMVCEKFTDGQILDTVTLCSNLKAWQQENTHFDHMHFMSHHLIHPNKWDAWPHYPFGRVKYAICNDMDFGLDGYIEELNNLSCRKVVDEDTAEEFLRTMGYLVFPANPSNADMKKYLDEDVPQAIEFFQEKKDLKTSGKLDDRTLQAMERTRRAYRL